MRLPHRERTIHAAILHTGCDIPAGKKVGGFKGSGSTYGCSRCFKEFEGEGFHKTYADFGLNEQMLNIDIRCKKLLKHVQ